MASALNAPLDNKDRTSMINCFGECHQGSELSSKTINQMCRSQRPLHQPTFTRLSSASPTWKCKFLVYFSLARVCFSNLSGSFLGGKGEEHNNALESLISCV